MVVEFECRTRLPVGVQEAFDRSRSIDLHRSSMARSRERAVGGVTTGLIDEFVVGPYLRRLIEQRNAHLLAASAPAA